MTNAQKPEVSSEAVDKAEDLWVKFTEMTKWGTIATIVILAIMAITLI